MITFETTADDGLGCRIDGEPWRRAQHSSLANGIVFTLAILAGAAAAPVGAAASQQSTSTDSAKSATVTATASNITVDGLLDEDVWHTAPTIGELTQREPRT